MAILKFRVYFEEDDSVYRDVVVKHTQSFFDMHEIILKAYEFDNKHKATFYRSNDHWQRGRQISLEKYDQEYNVPPLIMKETIVGAEIKQPNQRFVYQYDFNKYWTFLIELINVSKEESSRITYPSVIRTEGIAPSQYGTKGLLGEKFADVEEKYDLNKNADGFGEEGDVTDGEELDISGDEETTGEEEL
ncbi:MAG: hypothetical protein H0V30_03050 [Chitinophagaceae bacterium]|nr:hypothetical protein [Chitinophagaceae bacterium]